jgi:hypothetical protein
LLAAIIHCAFVNGGTRSLFFYIESTIFQFWSKQTAPFPHPTSQLALADKKYMLHRENKDSERDRKGDFVKNIECQLCAIKFIYYWKIRNNHHCAQANAGETVYAQLTKAQSILRGFSKWKLKRENPKKCIPPLAISSDFCTVIFQSFVRCKTKGAVGARAPYALLRHW